MKVKMIIYVSEKFVDNISFEIPNENQVVFFNKLTKLIKKYQEIVEK